MTPNAQRVVAEIVRNGAIGLLVVTATIVAIVAPVVNAATGTVVRARSVAKAASVGNAPSRSTLGSDPWLSHWH